MIATPWAQQRIRLIAAALLRHGILTGDQIGVMVPPMERRFPPPWTVEQQEACFVVRDANGQALGYFYFSRTSRDGDRRQSYSLGTGRGGSRPEDAFERMSGHFQRADLTRYNALS